MQAEFKKNFLHTIQRQKCMHLRKKLKSFIKK